MKPAPRPGRQLRVRKLPKQARSAAMVAKILAASARVFAEWGYAAGTTNRIAEEAGISVGSLYQYYPNKDSILMALVRDHVERGTQRIVTVWPKVEGALTLRQRVELLVDATIANHRDDVRLHQVLFEEAPRPPELLAELHQLETSLVEQVAAVLRSDLAVRRPDLETAAWVAIAATESLTHRYVSTHKEPRLELFRDELVDLVVAYLHSSMRPGLAAGGARRAVSPAPGR